MQFNFVLLMRHRLKVKVQDDSDQRLASAPSNDLGETFYYASRAKILPIRPTVIVNGIDALIGAVVS